MPKTHVNLRSARPLLDIASYARRGPHERLSPQELEVIALTARRTPEVMVKVSGGAATVQGSLAHLKYIDREGELTIETDQGERLQGADVEADLVADWDLALLAAEARAPYRGKPGRKGHKLVHNVVLSMPAGTPPERLLVASRNFARESFALQHRYAMVLHTGQSHPHVHLVIKAVREEGGRLNIRKSTLRDWRRQFAAHLRAQGIPANATERAVRGQVRGASQDGVDRAALRGESRRQEMRTERLMQRPQIAGAAADPGARKLQGTRRAVVEGWHAVADQLLNEGHAQLAQHVWKLIGGMPAPQTDDDRLRTSMALAVDTHRRQERTR
ncbi:MAG: relaxase/mobilization nuclease domain-containing protein [Steroidobacteraceae bacterium]